MRFDATGCNSSEADAASTIDGSINGQGVPQTRLSAGFNRLSYAMSPCSTGVLGHPADESKR
jgi:hypothetical protein